jgi:hypothetical protein
MVFRSPALAPTDERDTGYDEATPVAMILPGIKPHYHVDMWVEMKKIKDLTLKQSGNDPEKDLAKMKPKKPLIDNKDPAAYTDLAYVQGIFGQLDTVPVNAYALSTSTQRIDVYMQSRFLHTYFSVAK